MPLTISYAVSQNLLSATTMTVTDTSSGTDVSVTQRRILLQKLDGTYLVPAGTSTNYIQWSIANPSITMAVLLRDYALNITVQWLDVAGNVLYTSTSLYGFTLNLEQFFYQLTQYESSNPSVMNDRGYYDNKIKLRCAIDEAVNAVLVGNDIQSAQAAIERGYSLIMAQAKYF